MVGKIGMSLPDVYSLEMDELNAILASWAKQEETLSRERWEQTRFLAYCGMVPYQKKGKKLKPQDVMQFPWEKEEKAKAPTPQDIARMKRRFGAG